MTFRLVETLAGQGIPIAFSCRVLKVSVSGFHAWRGRGPSRRQLADAELTALVRAIHDASRGTYGVRRVHAELRLGHGVVVNHKRIERVMRQACLQGVHHRKFRRGRVSRLPAVFEDHVKRQFSANGPDQLWVTDITQHRTSEGWVYCAAVIDVFSRRCVGWSIAEHLRTELVVDAIELARIRRKPVGTIVHSDRGTQYTSWLFGTRLRQAGLMGSMGRVASAYDNALMESFWGSMQLALLDRRSWATKAELGAAIFEWIETFYNSRRRHSAIGYLSPNQYEVLHNQAAVAA